MASKVKSNQRRFHIIIDGWNCNPEAVASKQKVRQAIKQIALLCGMRVTHGPVVIDGTPQNPGWTGFAIIDFSHISIHTFTKDREICVDIFSCKPFDYEKVKNYVRESYGFSDQTVKYIEVKY